MKAESVKIAVFGLGYVGLPLAIEFAKHFHTVGYDKSEGRIGELSRSFDTTRETSAQTISEALKPNGNDGTKGLYLTANAAECADCNIFIVTVPTPIDESKKPDLSSLKFATSQIGNMLKVGDIVIYESTTYPGCTEEVCAPLLAQTSGLIYNKDFFVGYSPERINPGDKINTLTTIVKLTSGSTPEVSEFVDQLYKRIVQAGTHQTSSIKVAESAKAIENAQRDVNISFVNELAIIFEKIGIDTTEVLEAAATKWNFLKYKPGLVGGHCIGVDPYYLAYKAEQVGYIPDVILSGRRVNDQMAAFIANKVVKMMVAKDIQLKGSESLILGITFKENCADIRNTKVVDIYRELTDFGSAVTIYDPWANKAEVERQYGISILTEPSQLENLKFNAIILATAHQEFLTLDLEALKHNPCVVYDCKSMFAKDDVDARL